MQKVREAKRVDKLRILRAQKGLTLRQLEERSGVSKDAISEIERGLRTPRVSTILNLAGGLGVDPQELLGEEVSTSTGPFTAVFEQDGGGWIGYVEELPGANAQGETLEECRESLKEAVALVLETNRELTRREFEDGEVVREAIGA
jgi:transcriptional regulator with XRE-family HTH domain